MSETFFGYKVEDYAGDEPYMAGPFILDNREGEGSWWVVWHDHSEFVTDVSNYIPLRKALPLIEGDIRDFYRSLLR